MTAQPNTVTIEDRLTQWQQDAGWWNEYRDQPRDLPFAVLGSPTTPLTTAEQEEDALAARFVGAAVEKGWPEEAMDDEVLCDEFDTDLDEHGSSGDLLEESHTLLFARGGEGKSACRIVATIAAISRKFLVTNYLDVGAESKNCQEHAAAICDRMREEFQDSSLKDDILRLPNRHSDVDHLRDLVRLLVPRHVSGIFVMVDSLDENLGPRWSIDDMGDAVEHLFDPRLLRIKGLWFKFFVSSELAQRVSNYPSVSGGKFAFRFLRVRWTKPRLRRCLEDRVSQVSPRYGPTLQAIAEPRDFTDLDGEVVDLAFAMSGSPRSMFRLVHEMIRSHVSHQQGTGGFLLTRGDLEQAKQHVFPAIIAGQIRQQELQLLEYENRLIRARMRGQGDLGPSMPDAMARLADFIVLQNFRIDKLAQQSDSDAREMRSRLQVLDIRGRLLLEGQASIRTDLFILRNDVLGAYEASSRVVIETLFDSMQRSQLEIIQHIGQAINQSQLSQVEILEALQAINGALQAIRDGVVVVDGKLKESLAKLDSEISNTFGAEHKLKLTLPLLPILAYEVELKVGAEADLTKALSALWQRLRDKTRNAPQRPS